MGNEITQFVEEILFVIVLYKKALIESESFAGLEALAQRGAMCSVFLYDNNPESLKPTVDFTNGQRFEYPNENLKIFYQHDASNSGVSKAYNDGFIVARKLGTKWIMLLDQDTELNPDVFGSFFQASNAFPEENAFVPILRDRLGIVSPFRWRFGRGVRLKSTMRQYPLKDYRFLNSGLLIKTKTFEACGGYDSTIALYFSDIAFGEKLQRNSSQFNVVDFELRHGFSATEDISLQSTEMRYRYFCAGARAMSKTYPSILVFPLNAFLRGLNLAFQNRTFSFLKIFFETPRQ
jgi:rhamnosyltransferase